MTLGPAIIALALFDRISHPLSRPFVILGRVPLFYYLLHLVVIHALAIAFAYERYGHADWMFQNVTVPSNSVLPYPQGYGSQSSDGIRDLVWCRFNPLSCLPMVRTRQRASS